MENVQWKKTQIQDPKITPENNLYEFRPANLPGNDYDNSTIMVFNGISRKPNNEL